MPLLAFDGASPFDLAVRRLAVGLLVDDFARATSAPPLTIPPDTDTRVSFIEKVTALAMRLARAAAARATFSVPVPHVIDMGSEKQVLIRDAVPDVTPMEDARRLRRRLSMSFYPCHAVDGPRLAGGPDHPVSMVGDVPGPNEAVSVYVGRTRHVPRACKDSLKYRDSLHNVGPLPRSGRGRGRWRVARSTYFTRTA